MHAPPWEACSTAGRGVICTTPLGECVQRTGLTVCGCLMYDAGVQAAQLLRHEISTHHVTPVEIFVFVLLLSLYIFCFFFVVFFLQECPPAEWKVRYHRQGELASVLILFGQQKRLDFKQGIRLHWWKVVHVLATFDTVSKFCCKKRI